MHNQNLENVAGITACDSSRYNFQTELQKGGYVRLYGDLTKGLGLNNALFISELLSVEQTQSKRAKKGFNGWIYATTPFMQHNTSLTRKQQNKIIRDLEEQELLQKRVYKNRRFFKINHDKLNTIHENPIYIQTNKVLLRTLGIKQAVLLSELLSLKFYNEKRGNQPNGYDFYITANKIEQCTSIKLKTQKRIIEQLEKSCFITSKRYGIKGVRYFKIDAENIVKLIHENINRVSLLTNQNAIRVSFLTDLERPGKTQKVASKTPGQSKCKKSQNQTNKNNIKYKNNLNPTYKNKHNFKNTHNIDTTVKPCSKPTQEEFEAFVAVVEEKVGVFTSANDFYRENEFNEWHIKDKRQNYEWVQIVNWKKLFLARNEFYKNKHILEQKRKEQIAREKQLAEKQEVLSRKQKREQEQTQQQKEKMFNEMVWNKFERDVKQIKVFDKNLNKNIVCDISQRVKNQGVLLVGWQPIMLKDTEEFKAWSKLQTGTTAELLRSDKQKKCA